MAPRTLKQAFHFRHEQLRRDLDRHAKGPATPLRLLITGASCLIGEALTGFLESRGHKVFRLVRRPPASSAEIAWEPASGNIDAAALEELNAVIHLTGEDIGAGRWTETRGGVSVTAESGNRAALQRAQQTATAARSDSVRVGYYGETDSTMN